MNTNSKRLGIYLFAMLLATSVATTLRTVASISHLDYSSGFFTDKSLITIANVLICLTVVSMFSYIFTTSRVELRPSFSTGATYVPTGILGTATLLLGARVIRYAAEVSKYPLLSEQSLKTPSVLIGLLAAILAILSVAHHFLNAYITEGKADLRAVFSIATVSFLALYAMLIYLDGSLSLNDPSKILRQTSFLLLALFFLYETRISLGREMWRLYCSFGLGAASLAAYSSIPAIITYYVNGEIISSQSHASLASVEEYIFLVAAFVFVTARLFLTVRLREEKENELVKAIAEYAAMREARTAESEERFREIFASKQLSIFDLYGGDDQPEEQIEDEEPEAKVEETVEKKEITISDDAIYESIFGTMPPKPEEETEDAEEAEEADKRDPEQIAEEIFSAFDEAIDGDSEKDENPEEENEK